MKLFPIIAMYVMLVFFLSILCIILLRGKKRKVEDNSGKDFIEQAEDRVESRIRNRGVQFKTSWYFNIMMISPFVLGFIGYAYTGSIFMTIVAGAFGLFVPEFLLLIVKEQSDKNFEERYNRSLVQLNASLRSGVGILQAVNDVANCKFIHESMRERYKKLSSDIQMGVSIEEAFQRFADSTNSKDAQDVALAIALQNQVGGKEAEVIETISENIKNRVITRREIKSLFSSTSSMVWIMDTIFPLIIAYFWITNPEYLSVYFLDPFYMGIFILLVVMDITGTVINHKILDNVQGGV